MIKKNWNETELKQNCKRFERIKSTQLNPLVDSILHLTTLSEYMLEPWFVKIAKNVFLKLLKQAFSGNFCISFRKTLRVVTKVF